ncbi:MAG: hypothetical protein DRH37_01020 [Deltaproteobacteria bacterium]|nr:MAG: hypothetical protein DRH37_01020 [Deltaproteobacteria bacterium]
MKKYLLLLWALFLVFPAYTGAEDFLGIPVVPGGTVHGKTDARLQIKTDMTHNEVFSFYKKALKGVPDIKIREWKNATYIEDDGRLPWHSITISKDGREGTTVVIKKDTWSWIMGTLILRFIGVFVVLSILLVCMSISGAIISRSVERTDIKGTG